MLESSQASTETLLATRLRQALSSAVLTTADVVSQATERPERLYKLQSRPFAASKTLNQSVTRSVADMNT